MKWKLIAEEEAKCWYSPMVSSVEYWKSEEEEFFIRVWENGLGRIRSMAYDKIGPLGMFDGADEAKEWIEENFVGTQKQLDISKK